MTEPRISSSQRVRRLDAEHDLGGVLGAGEVHQRRGDVVAGHLVVLAAELVEQAGGGRREPRRPLAGEAVVAADVHAEQLAVGPLGDPGRPADQLTRRPGLR